MTNTQNEYLITLNHILEMIKQLELRIKKIELQSPDGGKY